MLPTEKLIHQVVKQPAFMYNGLRKIVQNLHWECPKGIPAYTYEQLGYTKAKPKQLERNYINLEELERVKTILERRKGQALTSVALSMRGAKKDSRSQGWCLLNIVVTRAKEVENVDIFYRSTELIFKFGADLVFLPTVFDRIGVSRKSPVRFHFANAFLSAVFLPTLLATYEDPVSFLQFMLSHDPKHFRAGTRFMLRSSYREHQKFPYSPENQQHRLLWRTMSKSNIRKMREYLIEQHTKFGNLPSRAYHALD